MNKTDNSTTSIIELKKIYKLKIMLSIIGVGLIISILIAYCIIINLDIKMRQKLQLYGHQHFYQ